MPEFVTGKEERLAGRVTYLETHVCLLTGGDVLACLGDLDDGDIVVVTLYDKLQILLTLKNY